MSEKQQSVYMEFKDKPYEEIIALLNECGELYHQGKTSKLTDQEYDLLYKKIIKFEEKHPKKISPTSPSQRVGATPLDLDQYQSEFHTTTPHAYQMWSLNNIFNTTELKSFWNRFNRMRRDMPPDEVNQFYIDCKMDGMSVELIYNQGKLSKATSRGDGKKGLDITTNILTISNIPKFIKTHDSFAVYGEVVIGRQEFRAINLTRSRQGLPTFATCRNLAAGTLMSNNPEIVKERNLKFFAWELKRFGTAPTFWDNQQENLVRLGFNIPEGELVDSFDGILSAINKFTRRRDELPYDIDGVVIKHNNALIRKALGYGIKAPLFAAAWKFNAIGVDTEIIDITWSMGKSRNGRLTPIANIKPININGTTITSVTLHNTDNVLTHQYGPGARIHVVRAGDVIPQITETISPALKLTIPEVCPYCGAKLIKNGVDLRCPNRSCQERLISQLKYIVGKSLFDIDSIGEIFIRSAVTSKTITSIMDIFHPITSQSKKVSQDLLDELVTRARRINIQELIQLASIPNVGKVVGDRLTDEFYNIAGMIKTLDDKEAVNLLPVSDLIKQSINEWWADPVNKEFIQAIANLHLPYCE